MTRLSLRLLLALLLIAPAVAGSLLVAHANTAGDAPAATWAGDPDDDWPWEPGDNPP